VETVAQIIHSLMGVMSALVILMLVYQLVISFFGFKRNTKDYRDFPPKQRFLVLVPAHNEETVIADIINCLKNMDYPKELYDFYILADNCEDRTADVARQMGAKVLEIFKESEDAPTGKPIVLQKALCLLEGYQNCYDMVMFFDADNLVDPNMFLEVNSQYLSHEGKVDIIQCYLGSKNKKGIVACSYFMTFTIINRFFQYSKSRLGLNCGIGGTGFAVSASYLYNRGGWTAMSLTEDFELQIEATCDGKRILWNHNVRIYDEKPTKIMASFRQRTRWAQGNWFVTFKNTARLFRAFKNKQVPFGEFSSTLMCMYSLIPYIILAAQMVLGLILNVFEWTRLVVPSDTQIPLENWFTLMPSLLLFLYSSLILFYVGDHMDNGNRFNLRMLVTVILGVLLNMVVITLAQVVGLFRYRHQNDWHKTEHSINCLSEPTLLPWETGRMSPTSAKPLDFSMEEPLQLTVEEQTIQFVTGGAEKTA